MEDSVVTISDKINRFRTMRNEIKMWWHDNDGISNFGDILSPYLVEKITHKKAVFHPARRFPWPKTYMVIGSILAASSNNCIVWGAGVISKDTKVHGGKFLAVRGPKTREVLLSQGYNVPEVYGDPAILLPKYYNPNVSKKHEIGIIPHIVDYDFVKKKVKDDRILVIDLKKEIEDVVQDILKCRFTFSSSLHGIIASHAYNVPSLWMKFSDKLYGDNIKFEDYFLSIGNNKYEAFYPEFSYPKLIELARNSDIESLPTQDLDNLGKLLLEACPFN